jgi:hypothetical protein
VRRAAARDANEPELIKALRQVGASVQPLSAPGVPDLLVGYRGVTYLLEVKMPLGPKGGEDKRKLTPDQRAWWLAWRGRHPSVVHDVKEALRAIGVET